MGNPRSHPETVPRVENPLPPAGACPACGYDLRGLPPICTCPECGFECDPEAMVVKLSPRRWHLKQVVMGILLMSLAAWVGRPANATIGDELPFWFLVGGATLFYFIGFCLKAGEPSRLLLTRRGIRFEDRKLDRGWTEWSHLKRAKYSWLAQRLHVIATDGRKLYNISWRQLGSPAIARECLDAVNRQIERYTG